MDNVKEIEEIAEGYLKRLQDEIGMPLKIVCRRDVSFGWVFFYNALAYAESGDIGMALAGNAPFLVDGEDGSLHEFGVTRPLEDYLAEYERARKIQGL